MDTGDLFLVSYYLEKGIDPNKILSLTNREKEFYLASALYWAEKKNKGVE